MSVAVLLLLAHMSALGSGGAVRRLHCRPDQAAAPATGVITGTVRDIAGGIVPGAAIIVRVSGREQQTLTGPDGRFTANGPPPATW